MSISLRAPRRGLVLSHIYIFSGPHTRKQQLRVYLMSYSYMVYVVQQQHEVKQSTCPTRALVPVQYLVVSDPLSTGFALLEALSSLVPMIQGHCWCGRGSRSPTRQV